VLDHHHFLFISDWLISTFTPHMIVSRGAKSVSIYLLHLLRVVYEERERERERDRGGRGGVREAALLSHHGECTSFRWISPQTNLNAAKFIGTNALICIAEMQAASDKTIIILISRIIRYRGNVSRTFTREFQSFRFFFFFKKKLILILKNQ